MNETTTQTMNTSSLATVEHKDNIGPWDFLFTFIAPVDEIASIKELAIDFNRVVSRTTKSIEYNPMRKPSIEEMQLALIGQLDSVAKGLSMYTFGVTHLELSGSRVGVLTTNVRK